MFADSSKLLIAGVAVSTALHVVVGARLEVAAPPPAKRPLFRVFFDLPGPGFPPPVPTQPSPPPAVAPAEPPSAAPNQALATVRQPATPPKDPPTPEPAQAEPPSELDLTGLTISSDDGHFSVPASTGGKRRGPIARRRSRVQTTPARPAKPATRKRPAWVALADLSKKPIAPALSSALRQNYPAAARAQGVAGEASVRAQIGADGVARSVRVLSESQSGFGQACRRSVEGSRWGAPLGRAGTPVATTVVYRCRFRVEG